MKIVSKRHSQSPKSTSWYHEAVRVLGKEAADIFAQGKTADDVRPKK